jgi:hypothetical protein
MMNIESMVGKNLSYENGVGCRSIYVSVGSGLNLLIPISRSMTLMEVFWKASIHVVIWGQ